MSGVTTARRSQRSSLIRSGDSASERLETSSGTAYPSQLDLHHKEKNEPEPILYDVGKTY